MELRQLEYVVAVAEEASFTKAAARVLVAQPGVSAQVRRLEAELGEPLFDRSGGTVTLTPVGVAFLPYARAALAAVRGARATVDELAGLTRGRVAVGMITAYGALEIPALLAGFRRAHPGVEIRLSEATSDDLLAGLRAGELDLAWVGLADAEPPPGIGTRTVVDEALRAVVAPSHPLAARASITLGALAREPLIVLPRGTGMRTALDAACGAAGLAPEIACEASTPSVLAELAAQGLGVAIIPASLASARDDLHVLKIVKPALRSRLALAWREDGPSGPAARALVAYARAAVKTFP